MRKALAPYVNGRALPQAAGAGLTSIRVMARWARAAWNPFRRIGASRGSPSDTGDGSRPLHGWPRLTAEARSALYLAHEEAVRSGDSDVRTEHLLLGVTQASEIAARLLDRVGVPVGEIRSEIRGQMARGHGPQGQDIQLTPAAKQAIHLAYESAQQSGCQCIGIEHLLLGLSGANDGLASVLLKQFGADIEALRQALQATWNSRL